MMDKDILELNQYKRLPVILTKRSNMNKFLSLIGERKKNLVKTPFDPLPNVG